MGDMFASQEGLSGPTPRPLDKEFEKELDIGDRAPILLLGYGQFDRDPENFEGPTKPGYYGNLIEPSRVIRMYEQENFKLPKKTVAIGFMNENWGWLSTHILNRTCLWGFNLIDDMRRGDSRDPAEQIKPFLDDPNLVMLLVNQHHNVNVIYTPISSLISS